MAVPAGQLLVFESGGWRGTALLIRVAYKPPGEHAAAAASSLGAAGDSAPAPAASAATEAPFFSHVLTPTGPERRNSSPQQETGALECLARVAAGGAGGIERPEPRSAAAGELPGSRRRRGHARLLGQVPACPGRQGVQQTCTAVMLLASVPRYGMPADPSLPPSLPAPAASPSAPPPSPAAAPASSSAAAGAAPLRPLHDCMSALSATAGGIISAARQGWLTSDQVHSLMMALKDCDVGPAPQWPLSPSGAPFRGDGEGAVLCNAELRQPREAPNEQSLVLCSKALRRHRSTLPYPACPAVPCRRPQPASCTSRGSARTPRAATAGPGWTAAPPTCGVRLPGTPPGACACACTPACACTSACACAACACLPCGPQPRTARRPCSQLTPCLL